ncbi:MAG: hypothetical protein RLZZ531_1577 [Bacteroidota bacterium]|jgi:hypothetical protein
MFKILAISSISLFIGTCSKFDPSMINGYVNNSTGAPTVPKLSNEEVISGLKEALNVGIKNAVNLTSITDGFLKNESIRLPFPPDALKARQKAIDLGMTAQVEKFETTLNRAAEEASKEALPIFMDAITNMSIQDGFAILNGGEGAASNFLKEQTTAKLSAAFSPKVTEAISKVKLTEYWSPIMTKYNAAMTLTGGEKINPDLNAYVTQKAIEGLFKMVALEENKIRKDPAARVSDLLAKVFGSL